MSCYDLCRPCGPTPLANSCNEPCVRQCQDSRVIIQPSPVVVTLPGPILSSFPQNTAVGSSTSAAVGSILTSFLLEMSCPADWRTPGDAERGERQKKRDNFF
uniref:feather keratin 2-like n=1 Tax=Lonchura striata TaxID=40157 RepID=UPI000B4CB7C7|nr:feather keratin 2-like [Lonchura striata domestica]